MACTLVPAPSACQDTYRVSPLPCSRFGETAVPWENNKPTAVKGPRAVWGSGPSPVFCSWAASAITSCMNFTSAHFSWPSSYFHSHKPMGKPECCTTTARVPDLSVHLQLALKYYVMPAPTSCVLYLPSLQSASIAPLAWQPLLLPTGPCMWLKFTVISKIDYYLQDALCNTFIK